MAKKGAFASIDVGTTKICTIVAHVGDGGAMKILGVGVVPSKGVSKGLIADIDQAKGAIRESIRKAERASGVNVESAYTCITGRHISSLNNRGVVAIARSDRLVRPEDLERVLASARSVAVPSDRRLLQVIPRRYTLDGNEGVKEPVGMHGFRLDVETHIVTAAAASVQNLVKCIRGLGVEVEDVIPQPLAASEAVLTAEEKEAGVIVADIGGGTTDIAVFREGSIWHSGVLSIGGYQVTRDISIGLGVPFDVAEEMKKKHATLEEMQDAKPGAPPASLENGHSHSHQELNYIVRVRIEELLRMILLELPSSDYAGLAPAGLVLTGGTANLPGIAAVGEGLVGLPVRVGQPSAVYGVADILRNPAYATSVGLLLWASKYEGEGGLPSSKFKSTVRQLYLPLRKLFARVNQ